MRKTLIAALALGALGVFWYIKWKSPQTETSIPNKLIVGTSADFQPFCYKDNDEIVGFDIDVAKEVVKRMHREIEFRDIPFELLIPQLQLGSLHFVAACMTPTPERALRIKFSQPYLTGDHLMVLTLCETQPLMSLADLAGKKVIVNQGYSADQYMSKLKEPQFELIRLPTVSDAVLALKSKRADAFVSGSKSLDPFFEQHGKECYHTFVITDAIENTAFALSPLHPKLAAEIDTILQSMQEDGTLEKLQEKWHLI